ncbi:MAG: ammonium transporter [Pirellulales bacterium]
MQWFRHVHPNIWFGCFFVLLASNIISGDAAIAVEPPSISSSADPTLSQVGTIVGATDESLQSAGSAVHNAWLMICSALVLFMTAPGLAMFYGGLVRKKNVLSVIMQCITLMGVMTVWWALVGYSLAFGGEGLLLGNGDHLLLRGVARYWDYSAGKPMTPMHDDVLPKLTHMLFQGMFFVITPAIMCGAFAERMRFTAMVVFSVAWGTLVYCPLAHWVWDGGLLAFGPKGLAGGSLDFAGGTVVHISSGVAALVAAYMVGPRLGHRHEPMPPHNLTYTSLGASMLWFGWFGFNAGSALRADGIAASAFVMTHLCAAAGASTWAFIEWIKRRKPTVLGASSGAVAGLVCITPAAGHVGPLSAMIMGVIAGWVCYMACSKLKSAFGYDDALDAFGIHGIGGTIGGLLTGVFATRAAWNIAEGKPLGAIEGNLFMLVGQLTAVAITWVFVATSTFLILKAIDMTIGLRVNSTMERQGLDVTQHGEEGYIFL